MRHSITSVVLAAAMVYAAAIKVSAQDMSVADEKRKPELMELNVEDLMKVEVEQVAGASRYLQKVTEAPASVTIVTAEEIKRYGYRTLADLLRSVRGFYVSYDRNYSYLGVRGFSRPGDYNTRVLVLVDGHRLTENVYGLVLISSEFPIDIDLIERVEVIRGPSSSLYGTNAFFGVINIITKKGRNLNGLEVSGEAASYNSFKARVSYGARFKNGGEVFLSGTGYDSRGHRRLYFKEFDAPETNNGIAEDVDGESFKQFFGSVKLGDFTLQAVYGARGKAVPTASYETAFNDPDYYTFDSRGYVDLKYQRSLNLNTELMGRVYFDRYNYYGDYPYLYEEGGDLLRTVNKDFTTGEWWGSEFNLTRLMSRHRLTLGVEYRDNLRQEQRNYDESPYYLYIDDRRDSKEWALYAEDEFRIRKNLLFNFGLRHDHSTAFGGSTNPRFGLVYSPFEKTSLKLLYGQAFRAPSNYELYYEEEVQKANPNLRPESIKTTEIILEKYIGDHFRLAAAGFVYKIKNLIELETDPANGTVFFDNTGKVRAQGVEVEMESRLPSGIAGLLSYAFVSAHESRDTHLTNSPGHMVKLNFSSPLFSKKTFAGLQLQYMSERKTPGDSDAEGFMLANLTLTSRRIARGLDFSLSVYNLFDKRYGDPGSEEHLQDVIWQDGRNFRAKLTYRFDLE